MVDLKSLDQFVESVKPLAECSFTEDKHIIRKVNEGCDIKIQLHRQMYLVSLSFKEKFISFEGAVSELTLGYLYLLIKSLDDHPFVFISSFFQEEFIKTEFDLLKICERIIVSIFEYDFFVKKILKLDSWDGDLVEIPDLKHSTCQVVIDKTGVPFVNFIITKKGGGSLERAFSIYDWLIYVMEDMSWIEYNDYVKSYRELPALEDTFFKGFEKLFKEEFHIDFEGSIYKTLLQIPLNGNEYILAATYFMNELGIIVKLYTKDMPYKPLNIKLPYRNNIKKSFQTLHKFIYLLTHDKEGKSLKNILKYYRTSNDIFMGLLVN